MSVEHTLRTRFRVIRVGFARLPVSAAVALACALPASAQEAEAPFDYDAALAGSGIEGSYGYVRTLDGAATVVQSGGERVQVEVNEPILVGDRVFVSGGSRAELVLADRNLVRLGDEAELGFRALAYSADRADPGSVLELRRGTLQLVVVPGQLGQDFPSVVTPNATVQPRAAGTYLVVVDDDGRTEVVVREGRADVLTDGDGADVRPGESVFAEGRGAASLRFAAAPSIDRLEAWGNRLSDVGYVEGEYIDDDLRYAAGDLDDHGSWITVSGGVAWRPYVSVGWAPYRYGRWRYTPSGLFWVSYEPWGWVPYHYGYWDYVSAYGWVWFPGRRFAPAHVYWYWGPQYAGWVPAGYYARHYGRRYGSGFGFYFGVYGHIGGAWDPYRYWTFCPTGRLGHRRQPVYTLNGYDLGRRGARLGEGILTTDTRALRPDVWRRPVDGMARLRSLGRRDGALPDARAFIERTPRLPAELERVTLRGAGRGASGAGASGRADAARPNVETRTREPGTGAPRLGTGRETNRAGAAGTLRTSPGATRGGAATLRRPGTGATPPTARPSSERTGSRAAAAAPPRPETRTRGSGATLRRPTSDPTGGRRAATGAPAGVRSPETRPRATGGRELRRPEPPVTRTPAGRSSSGGGATRPTVERRTAPSARPELRRASPSGGGAPAVRRAPASASRPNIRRAPSRPTVQRAPARPGRPTARSTPAQPSRPTVRRSARGGGSPRPTVRRAPARPSRPTVQRAPSRPSRPTVQRAPSRSGQPSGQRAPSRPSVQRAPSRPGRPSVQRAPSRPSRPSVRRSGGSGSGPASRGRGGRGSGGKGSG